jgi:hypothetical protein
MSQLDKKIEGPLKIFLDMFGEHVSTDDSMQFYSNRKKAGHDTYLNADFYHADKMSLVVVEEYGIRGKLKGKVIVGYPEPNYDVPIFTFQLGGNDTQSIALLDISPTLPDMDYAPLIPVFSKYKKLLGMEPSTMDWVNSICSPYLLHCQYGVMDDDLFIEAMRDYLEIWIEHYYRPGSLLTDEQEIEMATNAVYKYKHVLHANDPAYGIFTKEWGKIVADAFFYLETRNYPALSMPEDEHKKFKPWENKELNVLWAKEAQERVLGAPESVQQIIRETIESRVAAAKIGMITADIFDKFAEMDSDRTRQAV